MPPLFFVIMIIAIVLKDYQEIKIHLYLFNTYFFTFWLHKVENKINICYNTFCNQLIVLA